MLNRQIIQRRRQFSPPLGLKNDDEVDFAGSEQNTKPTHKKVQQYANEGENTGKREGRGRKN